MELMKYGFSNYLLFTILEASNN